MAKRQHKTPCGECPFRRVAPAGWLGGMTPEAFTRFAATEQRMPCHLHLGEGGKGARVSYANPGDAPQCAGRSIYWANQLKTPRTDEILWLPKDEEKVFSWPAEFTEYHRRGAMAEKE